LEQNLEIDSLCSAALGIRLTTDEMHLACEIMAGGWNKFAATADPMIGLYSKVHGPVEFHKEHSDVPHSLLERKARKAAKTAQPEQLNPAVQLVELWPRASLQALGQMIDYPDSWMRRFLLGYWYCVLNSGPVESPRAFELRAKDEWRRRLRFTKRGKMWQALAAQ